MAEATPLKQGQPLKAGQALIVGRIEGARSTSTAEGRMWRTLLKLPVEDEFSSAPTVEVRSSERLGQAGDVRSMVVAIGGYPRSFQGKGERGEPGETVRTAENSLTFVRFE